MFLAIVLMCWQFDVQNSVFYMTTPLQGSHRRVVLADAYTFGTTYHEAMDNRKRSYTHRSSDEWKASVFTWNGSCGLIQWEREMEWRHRCWDAIEDALNSRLDPCQRLHRLETLYDLLGEELFNARWLPTPTPNYRR